MRILFMMNDTGSRVWRMLPQARYMQSLGHEVRLETFKGKFDLEHVLWADLLIMEMVFDERYYNAARDHGKKIIYEIDDFQEITHKKHYAYNVTHGWQGYRRRYYLYRMMSMADAIIVSNRVLKDHYHWISRFGKKPKIFILGNYLDMEYWNVPTMPNSSGKFRILWSGGSSHTIDLEFIAPVIRDVLKKYEHAQFIYMGHGGWSSPDNKWLEWIFGDHFFKGIPLTQQRYELGIRWNNYSIKLANMQANIGIAPLVKNKFATGKTPIKAMEYGINGLPCIGSQFMYKDVIIPNVTGYLADTQDDFFKYLCAAIENEKETTAMGERAFNHMLKNFDVKDRLNEWRQVYESVF